MKFGLSDAILIFGTRESRRKYDGKRKSHTLHARSRLARRADRRGELREGEKLSGRSKLSPEYNVSPETVRRALRLLADHEGRGGEGAERCLHPLRRQRPALPAPVRGQKRPAGKAAPPAPPARPAGAAAPAGDGAVHRHPRRDGPHAGEPAELQLPHPGNLGGERQNGSASSSSGSRPAQRSVAIHRNLDCIVSPGPCAELYAGDSIVYVGDGQAREAVSRFFA